MTKFSQVCPFMSKCNVSVLLYKIPIEIITTYK